MRARCVSIVITLSVSWLLLALNVVAYTQQSITFTTGHEEKRALYSHASNGNSDCPWWGPLCLKTKSDDFQSAVLASLWVAKCMKSILALTRIWCYTRPHTYTKLHFFFSYFEALIIYRILWMCFLFSNIDTRERATLPDTRTWLRILTLEKRRGAQRWIWHSCCTLSNVIQAFPGSKLGASARNDDCNMGDDIAVISR